MMWPGLIEKYRRYLPVTDKTPVVTLLEGNTPLLKAHKLSELCGLDVYLKFEGLNPTGSFKDRGMTMAISKAKEEGANTVICASTGNTSASAAAYAARAGMKCVVLVPAGAVALGKMSQAIAHNAKVIAIKDNFDLALQRVREISQSYPITLVNSVNPYRIEGQKTGAFEICDQLGYAPDFHFIPVGNAGNITAYWKGYSEYQKNGVIDKKPVMMGYQAQGAAPIVQGCVVKDPKTFATAIKIGNPASWKSAEAARDESCGVVDSVSEEQIEEAYKLLPAWEGVFAEPASAASVAGLLKCFRDGSLKKRMSASSRMSAVCILTGHGLKDPDSAISRAKVVAQVEPDMNSILKEIGL